MWQFLQNEVELLNEIDQFLLNNLSNMITVVKCLISLEFLRSIAITSATSAAASLRKIPGEGINWKTQRIGSYLYADKTEYLEKLLDDEAGNIFFFISRPRRFGKSTFLQMANYFFRGDESLFKGLHIHNRGNSDFFNTYDTPKELKEAKWIQCPVIFLDFRKIGYFNTKDQFEKFYNQELRTIAHSYGLEYSLDRVPDINISYLIFQLRFKFQLEVVVLIDEYDSLFAKAFYEQKNPELAENIRGFLDTLFGNFKSHGNDLRLVLVLGVSRLEWHSLESGPNIFIDLTYEKEYAGAFGFTEKDIWDFNPEITHRFNLSNQAKLDRFIGALRNMYDGYNFAFRNNSVEVNVLNPVSTVKYLHKKEFGDYWISTGSMSEIMRQLYFSQTTLERLENSKLSKEDIEKKFNPLKEPIPIEILMLVYGYLTIATYNEKSKTATLKFSNKEIKTAWQKEMETYQPTIDHFITSKSSMLPELNWHMKIGNAPRTMNTLKSMFFIYSITLEQGVETEFDLKMRLFEFIRRAGIPCHGLVKFMKGPSLPGGDVDILTMHLKTNFVMKVKRDHSAITAIKQLIEYLDKYTNSFLEVIGNPKEAWFVGVNFTSQAGAELDQWIGIPLKNGVLMYDQVTASSEVLKDDFTASINKG